MLKQSFQILTGILVFIIIFIPTTYFAVYFFVKSEKSVIIPDVSGKEIIYVLELLSDIGLNIKVEGKDYHSSIPKNYVIYQDPRPGTEVKAGRDVSIILSKGSKWFKLPDIRGMRMEKAQVILDKHFLCSGEISQIYHPYYESGMIVSHFPEPGNSVTHNSCIHMLVSRGNIKQKFQMPDFTGVNLEHALMILNQIEIAPVSIEYATDNQWPENRIIDQNPPYGYLLTKEEPVHLTVNRQNQDDLFQKGGVSFYTYNVPNGFLQKHVLIRLNVFGVTIHVHDDFVRPAKAINLIIPNDCDASIYVYLDEELVDSKIY